MDYKLIRSKRKSIALQVRGGEIIVRAPIGVSVLEIEKTIIKHEGWIKARLKEQYASSELPPISPSDVESLAKKALEVIPSRVKYYATIIGVTYGRITIRNQKTRWGSCSSKGDLNFNCLLMMTPIEVLDSVIIHELCHRKHMNHSSEFYAEVLRVYPEYRKWNDWLKKNGQLLIQRMIQGMK